MPKPKPQPDPPQPPASVGTPLDQAVLARAVRKMALREKLTAEEERTLRRHQKEKEERDRWSHYRSIPQKHWRAMTGRQTKVLNEQAQRYDLPFGGPVKGGSSPALERYREERAALARLDRLEREGSLVAKDEIRQVLGKVASLYRDGADALGRQFGPEASQLLDEVLNDAKRLIDQHFQENTDDNEQSHSSPDSPPPQPQ